MNRFIFIVFICLVLFGRDILFGQDWLKNFSVQQSIQWQNERAIAESIAILNDMPIRVDRPGGVSFELQKFYHGRPYYAKTDNSNAAKTISTNKLYPGEGYGYSLTGNGILLGEWDAGRVLTTHQEFGGRVTSNQGSYHDHSTHVAGTMVAAGVVAAAKGMSYEANLNAFDWNDVESEMASEAAAGLQVSNHSWGWITGWEYNYRGDGLWAWFGDPAISASEDWAFGFYDDQARQWDIISRNAPNFLIVKSAGNDRGDGPNSIVEHWVWVSGGWVKQTVGRNKDGNAFGYDCMSGATVAKNVLTVGAVNDIPGGYSGPSSVQMSSFSAWGPTDDGRIKPDIVANGISLYSTIKTSNNAYGTMSGTSMSTPNASGSIGLILQQQKNMYGSSAIRSATVKALIINTADEAGSNNGPDYMYGWGLMNTYKAVDLMRKDSIAGYNTHIYELTLNRYDTVRINIASDGLEPLKATICWTDYPGTPPSPSLNPTTPMLVNDMDLRIIKKKNYQTYLPWILNPASPSSPATTGDNTRDNVEQVFIASPERTNYIVQITHKGTMSSTAENFSLVISGNVKILGPAIAVSKNLFEYTHIPAGIIHDSVKIHNNGDSLLILKPQIPDSLQTWLSCQEDSVNISPLDSTIIHFDILTDNFIPWKQYLGIIKLNCNDSMKTPYILNIIHNTLGPTLKTSPNHFIFDVDLNETDSDSIKIKNTGYVPLHVSIIDTGTVIPSWLSLHNDTGTVGVGDSIYLSFTVNEVPQAIGDYYTTLYIESDDYQTGVTGIPIELHVGTNRTLNLSVHEHWNIVSLPVITDVNLKNLIYPTAISDAYAYEGTYVKKDTLIEGTGYWLKFDEAQPITFHGYVFNSDTINLQEGWNLIGTISNKIPVTSIVSAPPDILTSYYFGYYKGYVIVDTLSPGQGYWIQANQNGSIILNGEFPPLSKISPNSVLSSLSNITISENGFEQILYFGSRSIAGREKYQLPPSSPDNFDARFSDGTVIKICDPVGISEYPIDIKTSSGSFTLSWNIQPDDKGTFKIETMEGKVIQLAGKGQTKITTDPSGNATLKLISTIEKLPQDYSLHQNYPNPFNPTTRIDFDLPASGVVNIKLYNLLGSEVATLFNGYKEAGYHAITFDASNLPSGIYFYKMVSDKFVSVRKMVLTK